MGRYTFFFSSHLHWLYDVVHIITMFIKFYFKPCEMIFFTKMIFYFIIYFGFNHRLSKVAFYGLLSTFLLETLWRSQAIMMNWRPTSLVHLVHKLQTCPQVIKKWKKIWEPCTHLKIWYLNPWCKIDVQKLSSYINGEKVLLKSNLFLMVKLLSHTYS